MVRAADARAAQAAEARAAAGASSAAELVAVLLATSVSRLPPELCDAKLALMSGALLTLAPRPQSPPGAGAGPADAGACAGPADAAGAAIDALLRRIPVSSDTDCAAVVALAARVGRPRAVCDAVRIDWAKSCLEQGLPGSALAWALRLRRAGAVVPKGAARGGARECTRGGAQGGSRGESAGGGAGCGRGAGRGAGAVIRNSAALLQRSLDAIVDGALARARTAPVAPAAPASAAYPSFAAARAAAAALPFAALVAELGRASEEARLVDDAIAAASGHREEQLDAEGKGCLAPIPRFPEIARSRSMQCVRHMRKLLGLLASVAAAEAAGARAGASASACAVSEGVLPLVRACGHHLAQLCALPVDDPFARPLADADRAGRALRLALAAGLLHAFSVREGEPADAPQTRPSARLAVLDREDVEAVLVRVEVEVAEGSASAQFGFEVRAALHDLSARSEIRNEQPL
jgi:hypothetical protein